MFIHHVKNCMAASMRWPKIIHFSQSKRNKKFVLSISKKGQKQKKIGRPRISYWLSSLHSVGSFFHFMYLSIHARNADTLVLRPFELQSVKRREPSARQFIFNKKRIISYIQQITRSIAIDSNYSPSPCRRFDNHWTSNVALQ